MTARIGAGLHTAPFSLSMLRRRATQNAGVGDRTRTGKPLGGGFSSHHVFRRRERGSTACVRALDYAFAVAASLRNEARAALGAPRLVSTPSAPRGGGGRLGSALPRRRRRVAARPGDSPNLRGSAPIVSNRALNLSSPLCLPISSPRQRGEADEILSRAAPPQKAHPPPQRPTRAT